MDYESEDPTRDERITAGGRVAVRTNDGKAEVGVSAVHEGTIGARGDLKGVDATVQIDDKTKLRAEYAQSSREVAGTSLSGNAYVVEVRRQDANVAATAYVRGQQGAFGLGQQAAAASGTTKVGGDVSVKVSPEVSINARALHERADNAGVQAERSQVEARANLTKPEYGAYVGGRIVRDQTSTGETLTSNQAVAGASHRMMDNRLNLRVDAELNLGSSSSSTSTDFPHRVRVGADYKVSEKITLFLDQEFTVGGSENTNTTRIGTKSKPWDGAESASSFNLRQTPDGPVVSSTSSMTQTMKLTPTLTVNAGMDRTSTLRKPAAGTSAQLIRMCPQRKASMPPQAQPRKACCRRWVLPQRRWRITPQYSRAPHGIKGRGARPRAPSIVTGIRPIRLILRARCTATSNPVRRSPLLRSTPTPGVIRLALIKRLIYASPTLSVPLTVCGSC